MYFLSQMKHLNLVIWETEKENSETVPNMYFSRLERAKNSYTRSLSSRCMENPRSLTKFLCWSFAINFTSFSNSFFPWLEFFESLFTATSCPSESLPCKFTHQRKIKILRDGLLYVHKKNYLPYKPHQSLLLRACYLQKSYLLLILFCWTWIVKLLRLQFLQELHEIKTRLSTWNQQLWLVCGKWS